HLIGHRPQQFVAPGLIQHALAHRQLQQYLDVHLMIAGRNPRAVVQRIGVQLDAAQTQLNPCPRRNADVTAFTDHLRLHRPPPHPTPARLCSGRTRRHPSPPKPDFPPPSRHSRSHLHWPSTRPESPLPVPPRSPSSQAFPVWLNSEEWSSPCAPTRRRP